MGESDIERISKEGWFISWDSLGTSEWEEYLRGNRLAKAWSPPENSPFVRFMKNGTIDGVGEYAESLKPRFSMGELRSVLQIENLIRSGVLGKNTAVILDGGGPQNVAIAATLARRLGYQPVVMLNAEVHPNVKDKENLAVLLYYAQEIERLKKEGRIKVVSPPVFILDAHRNDRPLSNQFDNSYTFNEKDFPDAEMLKRLGITTVVYLNAGDQNGRINPSFQSIERVADDLKQIVITYQKNGIEVVYTGVNPWGNQPLDIINEPLDIRPTPFLDERGIVPSPQNLTFTPLGFRPKKKNR